MLSVRCEHSLHPFVHLIFFVCAAKAGVVASLPARCSVIAAANPKQGSYNLSRTVAENLNMSKPILSRFDLVFVLRDRADKDLDRYGVIGVVSERSAQLCACSLS